MTAEVTGHAQCDRPGTRGLASSVMDTIGSATRPGALALGVALAATLMLAGGVPAAATASPRSTSGAEDDAEVEVETYGTVAVRPNQRSSSDPVYFAVHAVQRTPTATVVYLSVGFTGGDVDEVTPVALSEIAGPDARFYGGGGLTSTRVVDSVNNEVLTTLSLDDDRRGQPFTSTAAAFPTEPGLMQVVYAVLPPLGDGVTSVDVQVGFGSVVPDVPVADGLLTPTVEEDAVVLGTGWPEIDRRALADPALPDASRFPISAVTTTIDGSEVTTQTGEQVTIDVAADVLFAVDSAELSPEAVARVQAVAGDVSSRAAPGQVSVIGHTDSDGSDAYNDDLSRRRAEAVAAVLQPALNPALGLALSVEGRGEREPVADNSSPEGRQANRRVSVTFTAADATGETP